MDGNTSHPDEDEFIEALSDEMPQVLRRIEANQNQLDSLQALLE